MNGERLLWFFVLTAYVVLLDTVIKSIKIYILPYISKYLPSGNYTVASLLTR